MEQGHYIPTHEGGLHYKAFSKLTKREKQFVENLSKCNPHSANDREKGFRLKEQFLKETISGNPI